MNNKEIQNFCSLLYIVHTKLMFIRTILISFGLLWLSTLTFSGTYLISVKIGNWPRKTFNDIKKYQNSWQIHINWEWYQENSSHTMLSKQNKVWHKRGGCCFLETSQEILLITWLSSAALWKIILRKISDPYFRNQWIF